MALTLQRPAATPNMSAALLEEETRPSAAPRLLESRIFRTLGRNYFIQAEPSALHFPGYQIGKRQQKLLRLVNVSPDVGNVLIIPPQSRHFSISYRKANRLAPGLAFSVQVDFIPDEWRYYYDCLRILCKGEETLVVPLHGYPVTEPPDFPSHIMLRAPALGQSVQHALPLRSGCPVDFQFSIICTQQHPDFHISPTSGTIPGNGGTQVTVTFTPSTYGSAMMSLELRLSHFNAQPHRCEFTGMCGRDPAHRKESLEEVGVPPQSMRGPERASRKKRILQTLQQNSAPSTSPTPPQRPRISDSRAGPLGLGRKSRHQKAALFLQAVQQNVAEEEANQLRWQVRLGSDAITPKLRRQILEERRSPEEESQEKDGRPGYRQEGSGVVSGRVLREVGRCPSILHQFDLFLNDLWTNRNRALRRFQQAARQVLIGCRMNRRLGCLRKLLERLRSAETEGDPACESDLIHILPQSTDQILPYDFPPYPDEPTGSVPRALGSVTPQPAGVQLKVTLPFYDLKVPQHYRLMGYQRVGSSEASIFHPPRLLARPLRRGAEDELTLPDVSEPALTQTMSVSSWAEDEEKSLVTSVLTLTPPELLLNPPDLHPMHVFNPAPGLMACKLPMRYSEVDPDALLNPLLRNPDPRDPTGSAQRRLLTREEVIRGVMSWKKFPAVSLSVPLSAANSGPWPRWCDPFNADLLPMEAPPTLSYLPAKDQDNVAPRDPEGALLGVTLTPAMLRAEFPLIGDRDLADGGVVEPEAGSDKLEAGSDKLEAGSDKLEAGSDKLEAGSGDTLASRIQRHLRGMKETSHRDWLILD